MTTDTPTTDFPAWYYCTYRDYPIGCAWNSGDDPTQTRVEARRALSDHMNKEHKHS